MEIQSFLGDPLESALARLYNTPGIEIEPTGKGINELGQDESNRQIKEQRNKSAVESNGQGISTPQNPVLPNIPKLPPPLPKPRP